MRNILMVACAALLGAGCYAGHDSSSSSAASSVASGDAGVEASEGCLAFCGACFEPDADEQASCLRGCALREEVATQRGCADDFPAWLDCFAPNDCDYRACLPLRTCW